MRRIARTAAAVLACLALAAGCTLATPEQRLRDTVSALQESIDARDAGAIAEVVAADFVGNEGIDRDGARRLAAAVFLRHRAVGAQLGPLDVRLTGDTHATVEFSAVVTGGGGGWLPETGQVYRVRSGWRVEDGEWRLTSAEWTPQL